MAKGVTEKNEKLLKEIGTMIKKLREKQNMSQEEFAYEAGIDRSFISGIEKGDRNISITTFSKLTKALKIDINLVELLKSYV